MLFKPRDKTLLLSPADLVKDPNVFLIITKSDFIYKSWYRNYRMKSTCVYNFKII